MEDINISLANKSVDDLLPVEHYLLRQMTSTFGTKEETQTMMFKSAIVIYDRMKNIISHLDHETQWNIIYEATMIAYDSRIQAFQHMIDYKPDKDSQPLIVK